MHEHIIANRTELFRLGNELLVLLTTTSNTVTSSMNNSVYKVQALFETKLSTTVYSPKRMWRDLCVIIIMVCRVQSAPESERKERNA